MARLYRCDRCGTVYEPAMVKGDKGSWTMRNVFVSKEGGMPACRQTYELCPKCQISLEDWVEHGRR